mmetsp:Transcript_6206/g.22832  ORF Transcript_6206/g.22832 Transcript_6206/m.22832 type:complete len:282 (+) Transcript_6206:554-1399(+)
MYQQLGYILAADLALDGVTLIHHQLSAARLLSQRAGAHDGERDAACADRVLAFQLVGEDATERLVHADRRWLLAHVDARAVPPRHASRAHVDVLGPLLGVIRRHEVNGELEGTCFKGRVELLVVLELAEHDLHGEQLARVKRRAFWRRFGATDGLEAREGQFDGLPLAVCGVEARAVSNAVPRLLRAKVELVAQAVAEHSQLDTIVGGDIQSLAEVARARGDEAAVVLLAHHASEYHRITPALPSALAHRQLAFAHAAHDDVVQGAPLGGEGAERAAAAGQ